MMKHNVKLAYISGYVSAYLKDDKQKANPFMKHSRLSNDWNKGYEDFKDGVKYSEEAIKRWADGDIR